MDAISSDNPCGPFNPKAAEYCTYSAIALPGILLAFSALQRFIGELASRCFGGEVHGGFKAAANVISLFIQISLTGGLYFAAVYNHIWDQETSILTKNPAVSQSVVEGYDFSIKAMAYVSATFIVGVKVLGVFCHGPETGRLVSRATDAETKFEAALQLVLVAQIFLVSGIWTPTSILSGATSILVIGKVGVHNFINEQHEQLAKASLLGKVCVATSVLPVFVLTALFKIGSYSVVSARFVSELVLLLLAIVLPALVLLLLKIWLPLKDMSAATISQGLVAECVTLHIWPCGPLGRKIGLAIKTFNILLYSSFLAWTIANPGPKWKSTFATDSEADVKLYQSWEIATSARLQISAILCLVIGWTSFPLLVWQLFHQNK